MFLFELASLVRAGPSCGNETGNVLEDGVDQLGPVVDARGHVAAKDPAKLGFVHPRRLLDVVNLELYVWRDHGGHVRAEIIADNLDGSECTKGAGACDPTDQD